MLQVYTDPAFNPADSNDVAAVELMFDSFNESFMVLNAGGDPIAAAQFIGSMALTMSTLTVNIFIIIIYTLLLLTLSMHSSY